MIFDVAVSSLDLCLSKYLSVADPERLFFPLVR